VNITFEKKFIKNKIFGKLVQKLTSSKAMNENVKKSGFVPMPSQNINDLSQVQDNKNEKLPKYK